MTTPHVDAESVLAIDIGSIHTRAFFFDVVDGQYRFVGSSRASSTVQSPFFDISEGIHHALLGLQEITAHVFLEESRLVIPSRKDGVGVDQLIISYSAGPAVRTVVIGLLEDVSVESAKRLARSTYCQILDTIGMNDRRKPEMQIDAILQAQPDLLIIAGGTDQGATRSVAKIIDLVSLALQIVQREQRPEILYAGNSTLAKHVRETLSRYTEVLISPNIRPAIDHEHLIAGHQVLADATRQIRTRQLGGLQSYSSICSVEPVPSSLAFARMIRFLSQINNPQKGVLGIDIGAASTIVAGSKAGSLDLSVLPIGMGNGMANALEMISIPEIARWLPIHIPEADVRDYLWHKYLHPGSIPATQESLVIEQAVTRQIIIAALHHHISSYSNTTNGYEPVLASGLSISQTTAGQSFLILLDSLQPNGITTFVLDPFGLTTALGAVAPVNTLLPVQVVESNAYLNLGTVISPISSAKYGTPILRVKIDYEVGEQLILDVRQGGITMLPIQPGQSANVYLKPLRPLIIDPNRKGDTLSFKIVGGACGAVIDTRGRPLVLPADAARRRDLLRKWILTLGG